MKEFLVSYSQTSGENSTEEKLTPIWCVHFATFLEPHWSVQSNSVKSTSISRVQSRIASCFNTLETTGIYFLKSRYGMLDPVLFKRYAFGKSYFQSLPPKAWFYWKFLLRVVAVSCKEGYVFKFKSIVLLKAVQNLINFDKMSDFGKFE